MSIFFTNIMYGSIIYSRLEAKQGRWKIEVRKSCAHMYK